MLTAGAVFFGAAVWADSGRQRLFYYGLSSTAVGLLNVPLKKGVKMLVGDYGNRPHALVPGGCGLFLTESNDVADSYGLPSYHCQSMAYFATFWSASFSYKGTGSDDAYQSTAGAVAAAVLFWLLAIAVALQRNGRLPAGGVACHGDWDSSYSGVFKQAPERGISVTRL